MSGNKITVQFTDASIAQIDQNLKGLGSELQNKVMRKAIYDNIDPVWDDAQLHVPVRRGILKSSIVKQRISEFDAPGARVTVKRPGGYYAHLVEYGHRVVVRGGHVVGHVAARPFMRPALENNAERVVQRVGAAVAIAVQKYKGN